MEQRQLDRVADGLARLVLAADFFPRQLGHLFEKMIARLRAGHHLERHALRGIEPHFQAGLEFFLPEIRGTLDERVGEAAFLADAQAAVGQEVLDLGDGPAPFRSRDRR